jgi:predicted SnoaL-like aldol condensation-catalyzing enzyme
MHTGLMPQAGWLRLFNTRHRVTASLVAVAHALTGSPETSSCRSRSRRNDPVAVFFGREKEIVRSFLTSFEAGTATPLGLVDGTKFQNDPRVEGLKNLFGRLPKNVKVNIVRILADGDYVVTHTEYYWDGPKVAFDLFRFENGKIVEHWDNLQEKCAAPNASGRTQLDGPTEVTGKEKTEVNKQVVKAYWDAVVLGGQGARVAEFRSMDDLRQHNCDGEDNKSGSQRKTGPFAKPGFIFKIEKVCKILGEGNFVLVMSEGLFDVKPTAFYDLYRVENGKMVEHWDVLEPMPAAGQSRNNNGKF